MQNFPLAAVVLCSVQTRISIKSEVNNVERSLVYSFKLLKLSALLWYIIIAVIIFLEGIIKEDINCTLFYFNVKITMESR